MKHYKAGRVRFFEWRGWYIEARMFGNLWLVEYLALEGPPMAGAITFHRGTSPADVAGGIMRELRSAL